MIFGVHMLMFSRDAAADRAFIRDVLEWPYIEDGDDDPPWLIFKAPPSELGVHPTDGESFSTISLMCDDIAATVERLAAFGYETPTPVDRGYGIVTTLTLPSGAELGLYEPRHALALDR